MIVFVDDSGDAGFKLDKGSSSHFVIALVIFDDELEAEQTATAIKKLRRELKFSDETEFKFFKSKSSVRQKFLYSVNPFKFRVRCIVVNKAILHSEKLRGDKNSFYGYVIKTALKNSEGSIVDAKIRIDGGGDRIFRKSFLSYLSRELNSRENKIAKNCKFVDSKGNVLIQLADMIAGSIRRSYDKDRKDKDLYKTIFKKHIEDEWNFK